MLFKVISPSTFRRLFGYFFDSIRYEIVFVDDFSTDNSFQELEEISKTKNQILLCKNKKKGLGGAITEGINKSTGEAICIMMCDFSDDIIGVFKFYGQSVHGLDDEDVRITSRLYLPLEGKFNALFMLSISILFFIKRINDPIILLTC